MLLHMCITPLCSYLVVVFDVSDNSAEVLDSEVDIIVHLFVHSVVCRIWVSEEEREKKGKKKKKELLTNQNLKISSQKNNSATKTCFKKKTFREARMQTHHNSCFSYNLKLCFKKSTTISKLCVIYKSLAYTYIHTHTIKKTQRVVTVKHSTAS